MTALTERERARQRGQMAESLVTGVLRRRGHRILGRNVRVGRLELDVVACTATCIVVVEVRYRSSTRWGHPAESVDRRKLQRLRRATWAWMRTQGFEARAVRIDVAAVQPAEGGYYHLDYYENVGAE